jgi:hypothetical protein
MAGDWRQLEMSEYQRTFYLSIRGLLQCSYNSETGKVDGPLRIRDKILLELVKESLVDIHAKVRRDPLEYHKELLRNLNPALRFGTIPRQFCKILLPDWNRFDLELQRDETALALELLERNVPKAVPGLTANAYFEYCRIAYVANPRTHEGIELSPSVSGRELYAQLADGRDSGLMAVEPDSAEAFARWYAERPFGGHPWEIYRGGNATHIDLGVRCLEEQPERGLGVYLGAFSSTRLVETVRIALALHAAGLSFEWLHRDSYIDRLRGDDHVGIVPRDHPLSYGYHYFSKELRVSDCIHYDMLRDYNTGKPLASWPTIKGIISWAPLRPLTLAQA